MPLYVFWVCFGPILLLLCVLERILNALLSLVIGSGAKDNLRAGLLMGSVLNLFTAVWTSVVSAVFRCIGFAGWVFLWYAFFYLITSLWYVLYEDHPEVIVYLVQFYTKRVGPFLHGYLFLPLDLLNVLLKAVLPVYNSAVWVLRGVLTKGLLPVLWDQLDLLVDFCMAMLGLGKSLSMSIVDFIFALSCDDLSCLTKPALFDAMSAMNSVRDLAVVSGKLGQTLCPAVSVPVDFALYLLIDVRFARAVHGLANSLLHFLVHTPRNTIKRCQAHGKRGSHVDVLMCTPDLAPAFDHAVSGVRELGAALDNWLAVGSAMARGSLTGLPDDCSARTAGPDRFRGELLEGVQVTVGLTDWLMAATNGTLAYFWGQVTTATSVRQWPEPVDVSAGVAAVAFDDAGEIEVSGVTQGQRPSARATTSLLGCRCLDTTQGIVVRCSVLPLDAAAAAATHSFDVFFQDSTWSSLMTCSGVELSVRSVRWPVRRFEGKSVPFAAGRTELPDLDCISRGTCESVDATIWLVPRCDVLRPEQCSDAAVGTSCFPFCMAARMSGSRNANPVFANAEVWRSGRQLLMRDCALSSPDALASRNLFAGSRPLSTAAYGGGTLSGAGGGSALFVSGSGDGSRCVAGTGMSSWVPSNASASDPRSVPAYLRRRGQPFAIAGDALLIEFRQADGASTVEVDRLTGNQRDVYTLAQGWAGLPTAPKFIVPIDSLSSEERARVVVPMDYVASRVPSTSSRNYVFYAVSPDLQVFEAYLNYCSDPSSLPQVQVMMVSSYSALRVYRVRAYCQTTCEAGDLTAQFTFDGFLGKDFGPDTFPQNCSRRYNASVEALEYVNEQNLAVTVQVADATYRPRLRSGSGSKYVTYWLNPQSMQVRHGSMWPTELPAALTAGLCVSADGVPHVGTLGAELVVAGLHLFHRVAGVFVYAPGLLAFWRGNSTCPLEGRGHSVLESCARSVLSLDDFFDSLDSATSIFWGIPGWVAEQMEQGRKVDYSPLSDLLRGIGVYGEATMDITQARGGVLSLLNTPLPEQLSGVYALVRQPGSVAGASKIVGSASSWARFFARYLAVAGADFVQKLAVDGSVSLGYLWRLVVNTLYDHRPFFKSTVTDRGVSGCMGLQIIFGGANPPGRLLHQSCMASVMLIDGALDLFLHVFVDAPVVKCVCKDSEGRKVAQFAKEFCMSRAPQTMQPLLHGMISNAEGLISGESLLCPAVVAYTKTALESSMQPYFAAVFSSLEALGDSVDYMLSGYDTDSGRCSDFRSDPQVVVIMPEPVDYFRACGATTYCRTKCAGNWEAFDRARAAYDPTRLSSVREVDAVVDSPFFPVVVPDMVSPGRVVALAQPDQCGTAVCRSDADDCLAVAMVIGGSLVVSFYCVPSAPSSSVYLSDQNAPLSWGSPVGQDASKVSFLVNDGSALAALTGQQIVLARRGHPDKVVMDVGLLFSLPLLGMVPLNFVDMLAVRDKLLVTVAVRTGGDNVFKRDLATVWLEPMRVTDIFADMSSPPSENQLLADPSLERKWQTYWYDVSPLVVASAAVKDMWRGYAACEYPPESDHAATLVLWPLTSVGSVRRLHLAWSNKTVSARVEVFELNQELSARATLMPRQLVLSKNLRQDASAGQVSIYSSAGNVYDWLRQLRLRGSGSSMASASLSNAQPVKAVVGVNTSCDGLDCRGCPDLTLRSLCSAYQSCSVFKCVGTPVNLKRPLCGVGQTLKSLGNVGVANVQGAWIMFVDVFMILLQLKTVPGLPGVDVSFPDDSFLGNVCAAKDVSAEFFSILTSTVNSILQRVQGSVGVFSRFSVVDTSVNTIVSMSMSAITGFLHQLALAPVYVLSVGHKVMMCQVSGFLAITSVTGIRVDIQPAKFASTDAIGGRCLTRGAEVSAEQTGDASAVKSITGHAAEILVGSGQAAVMRRLEPYMHMMDGFLAYVIGVVSKLADVLQATDIRHCVLPDVTLQDTVRCACGDQPLTVPPNRSSEGLAQFAYWCTGTISLVDPDNRVRTVWNPYSYAELRSLVGDKLDAYVLAAGQSALAEPPNVPLFAQQGVSVLAVLTRCRQNFVNKQWDAAAFVRYDSTVAARELQGRVQHAPGDPLDGVGQCLLDSVAKGVGNGACLDSFLRSRGYNSRYWEYVTAPHNVSSHLLDGCMVFSGPASSVRVTDQRRLPFQRCLMGFSDDSACDLSGFVWSPASSNDVPVAVRHAVRPLDDAVHLRESIFKRMQSASRHVMDKLADLQDYSNDRLQAMVFSSEGDVIHQLMDCAFMGPYARMDYWPAPRCDEELRDDCLVGPYWSRDDRGGKTRRVNVDDCNAAKEIPFTCGSPSRKAMVRHFVKDYLETGKGGAEMVTQMVQNWIFNMTRRWEDPFTFSCNCTGCCDGYLPRELSQISLTVPTASIINALGERMQLFYAKALQTPEPWVAELDSSENDKYNWTTSVGSHQVSKFAVYDTTAATVRYDASEAASPPRDYLGPSLWRTCHASLKQVMFTMPVAHTGELLGVDVSFSGGGPRAIEEAVRTMVAAAKDLSPLYRHYQARHHPSQSRVCHGSDSRDSRFSRGSVRFDDFTVQGVNVFNASEVPAIPVLGYDAGSLGGAWAGALAGLTEHLGFLDRASTEQWLAGAVQLVTSSEYMMRYGPGGLKLGNLPGSFANLTLPNDFSTADLDQVLREFYRESDRMVPVESAPLHGCSAHAQNSTDLLVDFVDSLFPMAQGVRESRVGSYCLRYAVELAMLHAMEFASGLDSAQWVAQKELVVDWKRKCGTQVQLVGLCNSMDVYHPSAFQFTGCVMPWNLQKESGVEMYVTPECLVKIGNFFYDPCQCKPERCEAGNQSWLITRADLEGSECRLRFDPRSVVQSVELGWWGEDVPDPSASAWNAWLAEPVNMLNLRALAESLLEDGQSVGNAPLGQHWARSEGFLNVTGAYCDMVSDYWPETLLHPAGYHVTMPCHLDDAGYRTFDNVFALDFDASGQPVMRYMEDQTRDADLVDSHFGAGGLCRGINFGMDMYETNTMRVCTRVTQGEDVDVHVPRGVIGAVELELPRCSESSLDLPWGDHTFHAFHDSALYSVGTVPNLPSRDASVYPETGSRYMEMGPQQDMQVRGWGDSCQDFSLPNCSEGAWRCPDGFVCVPPGVCQHPRVECLSHSMCPSGRMCSGLGTCEVPHVSVLNELGEDASVRAHTTECSGQSYSMRGASYWGYVPDLLEAHGMCSYRHWQEYLYTLSQCSCPPSAIAAGACNLQADTCPFYSFSRQQISNRWWNDTENAPTRLKMIPTTCDRDYERFTLEGREMKSCVPASDVLWLVQPTGEYQQSARRDKMWQMYDELSKTVPLLKMPYRNNPSTGYLPVQNIDNIRSCMSVQQCYVGDFTKNGRLAMLTSSSGIRMADRTIPDGTVYDPNDQFRCGVIGYYSAKTKKCQIDHKLFPLYYAMCKQPSREILAQCRPVLKTNSIPAKCDDVRDPYDPDYSVIHDINVPALNNFFYIFNQPQTLSEHLNLVSCVESIYSLVSLPQAQGGIFDSKGIYIPFAFALYEIPFSWFYQCMVGSSIQVPVNLEKKLFKCTFFENKHEIGTVSPYYNDFSSYIFNIRGGYRATSLGQALQSQLQTMLTAWNAAVEEVRSSLFTTPGQDLTYPRCYSRLEWNLPNTNVNVLRMIESFTSTVCSRTQLDNYMRIYNTQMRSSYNSETIVAVLTTLSGDLKNQGLLLSENKLLTGLIKNWGSDYLRDRILLPNLDTSSTPLKVNFAMPEPDSPQFAAKLSQWKRLPNVLPNDADKIDNIPLADGNLKNLYADADGRVRPDWDTNLLSGLDSPVQVYSVYANGLFACSYQTISIPSRMQTLQLSGRQTDVDLQFDRYAQLLYGEVKRIYDLKMASSVMQPINLDQLNFYQDEANLFFGRDWKLNLNSVQNYLNNINPDVRTPVMCVAGNQQVEFNTCSDPNFAALKDHAQTQYSKNSGVVVPSLNQLDWPVAQSMLVAGAIFSFSSVERNVSKQFLNRLFDPDSVCAASSTSSSKDKLCYIELSGQLGNVSVISPWMSGWWNPFDKCDVNQLDLQTGNAEVIDSLCYFNEFCPPSMGMSNEVPYYGNMPNRQCKDKDNERTNHINVNPRFLYNLCRHRLNEDSFCNHTQGMLGGTDGNPSENYDVGGNLFTLHAFSSFPSGEREMFGNALLTGAEVPYGFWRSSAAHLGGHHLGLKISGDGKMKLAKLPLKPVPPKSRMEHWGTEDVTGWAPQWAAEIAADSEAYQASAKDAAYYLPKDARGNTVMGWDCPLRRRAFYGADVPNFRPQLPSARRSRLMFGSHTKDSFAHPTQRRYDASGVFANYKTTNGFCFCPITEELWDGMCSVSTLQREEHNCSLYNTVRALRGRGWGWSHTFRPRNSQNEFKTCGVQVDWPFVQGTLRDGANVSADPSMWSQASDVERQSCHVLDRAPDFAYAYVSKRQLRRSGFHTLAEGVCHTGRAQRVLADSRRCVRVVKGKAGATLRCSDGFEASVNRSASKTPGESVKEAEFSRRLCGKCTRPPRFVTRNGAAIPPESSFGLPYRVSAERAISKDLRRALCGNSTDCALKLNATSWRVGAFLPALLTNPRTLFREPHVWEERVAASKVYEPSLSAMPDDSALWAKPWVYCPTKESLRTGVGCNGSLSKQQWRGSKVSSCYSVILQAMRGGPDPFAETQICNIDSRLSDLCVAIREAQSMVAAANCLQSGDEKCAIQEFVYNPSTWETTNQAFVHQTVQEFYSRIDGCTQGGDCICPVTDLQNRLRANNTYVLKECSAVPVMAFRDVLVQVRGMVYLVCRILSLLIDIAFNLALSMVSSSRDTATSNIVLSWAELKQQSQVLMDKVADMFFDMIFSVGTLGPWLKSNIMSACGVVNSAYVYFADFWCNLVVQQLPLFLGSLRALSGWFEVGWSIVNDVFSVILDDMMPNALIDLYQMGYREYFQSSRYREKQAAYEDRRDAGLLNLKDKKPSGKGEYIPPDNKFLQGLADAKEKKIKNAEKRSGTKAAKDTLVAFSNLPILGQIGGVVDVALTGYELYQTITTAIKIKELLDKFPTSFTVFDFDDFYLSLDAFVEFLNADFTCYTMNANVTPLQCTLLNFTEPTAEDVRVQSPRASACWAEAQQRQVGVSNLYSCTATSTCCSDATRCDDTPDGMRLCGECPVPPVGLRTYGCNTMIQRCQCGVESFQVDRCTAQRDCGPKSGCSLLTSLDDVSFGSLHSCSECSTSSICLMGGSQQFGQCTCLASADAKVELCSGPVGSLVSPAVSKLCGVARDSGGYYAWSELSLIVCASAVSPRCAEVVTELGAKVYMAVSTTVRASQVGYSSRRLLSVDPESGAGFLRVPSALLPENPVDDLTPEMIHRAVTELPWNHTAAPCSSLAHAYRTGQHLGPVDEVSLHSCVYWRTVARQLIAEHSLSSLAGLDTFLLSSDDFAATLGQRGVLREILLKPWLLVHAVLYSQWAKPVRAALVASHDANVSFLLKSWASRVKAGRVPRINLTDAEERVERGWAQGNFNGTGGFMADMGRRRRLLGLWEDTRSKLRSAPYFSIIKGAVSGVQLPDAVNVTSGQLWLLDAFVWNGDRFSGDCPVVDSLSSLVAQSVGVSKRYYAHLAELNVPPKLRKRFKDVLPTVRASNMSLPSASRPLIFGWAMDALGLRMSDVVEFLSEPCPRQDCSLDNRFTATYMAESLLFCDLESVMFCSQHRNDMVLSFVFMLLVYIVVSLLCGYFGLYGVSTAFFLAIPLLVVWYSLGISPRCFPMIPTCLLDDALAALKSLFPVKAFLPKLLVGQGKTLKSCSALNFTTWEDPLAFAVCDLGFCDSLSNVNVLGVSKWRFDDMRGHAASADADAYRVCASVTATYSVVPAFIINFFLAAAVALSLSALALVGPCLTVLWQTVMYNHVGG